MVVHNVLLSLWLYVAIYVYVLVLVLVLDDIINANHESAQRFMEDMELAVLNQDHTQI